MAENTVYELACEALDVSPGNGSAWYCPINGYVFGDTLPVERGIVVLQPSFGRIAQVPGVDGAIDRTTFVIDEQKATLITIYKMIDAVRHLDYQVLQRYGTRSDYRVQMFKPAEYRSRIYTKIVKEVKALEISRDKSSSKADDLQDRLYALEEEIAEVRSEIDECNGACTQYEAERVELSELIGA